MYAGRNPNASITVLIVDDQELVCEALASLCARIRGPEIARLARNTADAVTQLNKFRPDLILWSVSSEAGFFDAVGAVVRRCVPTKVVLLDQRTVDAHARQALRIEVAGYLTKQQSFAQFERALREAHEGELVFVPDVSERLQFTNEGMRLAAIGGASPLARLTAREMDVLVQISQGLTVKECAHKLGISASTVDNHKARLMRKLNIHKTVDLTRLALAHGLLPTDPH
jgi:two-component system, NarL family, invasion response regulator UvrY